MKPIAKLYKVTNGWVAKMNDLTYVFDDHPSEHGAFAELLRMLAVEIGPMDSRYSSERIYVEIKPGDKHGIGDGEI